MMLSCLLICVIPEGLQRTSLNDLLHLWYLWYSLNKRLLLLMQYEIRLHSTHKNSQLEYIIYYLSWIPLFWTLRGTKYSSKENWVSIEYKNNR